VSVITWHGEMVGFFARLNPASVAESRRRRLKLRDEAVASGDAAAAAAGEAAALAQPKSSAFGLLVDAVTGWVSRSHQGSDAPHDPNAGAAWPPPRAEGTPDLRFVQVEVIRSAAPMDAEAGAMAFLRVPSATAARYRGKKMQMVSVRMLGGNPYPDQRPLGPDELVCEPDWAVAQVRAAYESARRAEHAQAAEDGAAARRGLVAALCCCLPGRSAAKGSDVGTEAAATPAPAMDTEAGMSTLHAPVERQASVGIMRTLSRRGTRSGASGEPSMVEAVEAYTHIKAEELEGAQLWFSKPARWRLATAWATHMVVMAGLMTLVLIFALTLEVFVDTERFVNDCIRGLAQAEAIKILAMEPAVALVVPLTSRLFRCLPEVVQDELSETLLTPAINAFTVLRFWVIGEG